MASQGSLAALLKNVTLNDHEEILKAANAALKANKNERTAQIARAVALLKLDRFEDALEFFDEQGEPLKKTAPLEYAYTLYKLERLGDAQQAIEKHGNNDQGTLHMKGQIAYRTEDSASAAKIYKDLTNRLTEDVNTESDFSVNQSAIDVQNSWGGMENLLFKRQPERQDLEQFESAFNIASSYMAQGKLKQAEFLLRRARDLCNASEGLSMEEKRTEVAPIETQLACVLCWQGKYQEAKGFASAANVRDNSDQASQFVAQINRLVAGGATENPYLTQRAFKSTGQTPPNEQLFSFQRSAIARNELTVDLMAHKFNREWGDTVEAAWAGVYSAAAHARSQTGEKAIKELLPLLERKPDDIGLLMTIVQLYALSHNFQAATSLVETFLLRLERSTAPTSQDVRFSPSVVGILISLYSGQHRLTAIKTELIKVAQHWRRRIKDEKCPVPLLKAAGAALLEDASDDDRELAREIFQALADQSTVDEIIAAGLIASGGEVDTQGSEAALQPIDQLIDGIDVSTLESEGAPKLPKKPVIGAGMKRTGEVPSKASTPKRMRRSRQPKDFDPARTPDPERWLPLRDRSSWKPKGKKKGKAAQGMATQGGIASEENNAQQQQSQPPPSSKPGGLSRQKKKKGKNSK